MIDLSKTSVKELLDSLKGGKTSCEEIMKETLNNIKHYDGVLEAYISVRAEEELLAEAREADKRRAEGKAKSLIDGLPIALKDNIHSRGLKTTCGSKILANYDPSFDATVSKSIKKAGGIVIGKTNLDEFAMGSTCETSALHKTKNPWDTERVPGGSSGGSAVAVAAGMAPLALGSDTGGSIRQPAAFCGIVGLKPTYGLVSRFGLVAYASSLDQIGTFAKDVYGSALMLSVIAGADTNDSTSLGVAGADYTADIEKPVKDLKVAVFPEVFQGGVSEEIKANFESSLEILKGQGATVEEVNFPALEYVISTYYFIATAEACSNLSRYDGVKYGYRSNKQANYDEMLNASRSFGFGKEVKKRILLGNFVLSSGYYDAYYKKAQQLRKHIMDELKTVFEKYDVIAMPTTPDVAFKFGETEQNPLSVYLADITTVLPNLSGLPAISLPSGKVKGMPVGLQLIGKPLSEAELFRIGYSFTGEIKEEFTPDLSTIERKEKERKAHLHEEGGGAVRYTKELINEVTSTYKNRSGINTYDRVFCSDLESYVGKRVKCAGSIYKINSLGGVEFYTLRDRTGMTQLVLEGIDSQGICAQTVVEVEGEVTKEDRSQYRNIEIKVSRLKVLGEANSDLPINISGNLSNINLPTILDNRGISIRNSQVQKVFLIQSEIVGLFSKYLREKKFIEIKTPKIISSGTEGGANIFELKYFGKTAYLAQSPQFYKQMMVGSGYERVFEVGSVFRAEKSNTVRHLSEYCGLDFEMAYIKDEQDIIDVQEEMLIYILKGLKDKYGDILNEFDPELVIPESIPRIHFLEALEIAAEAGLKDMDGDISPEGERVICDYFAKENNSPFIYIIGYPVKKRPMYTMPDERLPGYTRSFDLLYKGLELTTGGQRIHNYEQLRENVIQFGGNPAACKDYLQVFKYGMPPHGGLGMGLERFTMKILNLANVREAALFPRDVTRLSP